MDELRQQFEAAFPQSGGALVAQPKEQTQNDWGYWPDDLMGKAIKALTLFGLSFAATIPLAFLYVQFGTDTKQVSAGKTKPEISIPSLDKSQNTQTTPGSENFSRFEKL